MLQAAKPKILPAIMGTLCQEHAEGTLVLEQNDGTRRFFWENGRLVHLQSDVAGEQLGNYLLRQGVLDLPALNELLANEEQYRIGEKIVQWGLMSLEERDRHLAILKEQVMVNALEHDIVEMTWHPGTLRAQLDEDIRCKLDHRAFVWATFQEARNLNSLSDLFFAETKWRWIAQPNLLDSLSDLPLTPQVAYTLSLLGAEPIGFETFLSLSGLEEEDAARLLVTLWALGGLTLTEGDPPFMGDKPFLSLEPETLSEPIPPEPVAATLNPPPPAESILTVPWDSQPKEAPAPALEFQEELAPVQEEAPRESSSVRARKGLLKAKSMLLQDRTAEAVRFLEESVRLDPDSESAYEPWLLLGKLRLANPAWSTRAIEALQVASRLKPKAGEPWALMGELYHRKGFKANAKACFKKALELDPSVLVPADVNVGEEDEEPESKGLLHRFKSMLGR